MIKFASSFSTIETILHFSGDFRQESILVFYISLPNWFKFYIIWIAFTAVCKLNLFITGCISNIFKGGVCGHYICPEVTYN